MWWAQRNKDETEGETMALSLEFRRSSKEKHYGFEFKLAKKNEAVKFRRENRKPKLIPAEIFQNMPECLKHPGFDWNFIQGGTKGVSILVWILVQEIPFIPTGNEQNQ